MTNIITYNDADLITLIKFISAGPWLQKLATDLY
jgi:hypothetical protein